MASGAMTREMGSKIVPVGHRLIQLITPPFYHTNGYMALCSTIDLLLVRLHYALSHIRSIKERNRSPHYRLWQVEKLEPSRARCHSLFCARVFQFNKSTLTAELTRSNDLVKGPNWEASLKVCMITISSIDSIDSIDLISRLGSSHQAQMNRL